MVTTVPGRMLTRPEWLAARIAEMGHSWGTTSLRIAGTLWWCMVASALVEQIARAYAHDEPAPEAALDRLDCEVRPDGGIERVRMPADGGTTVGCVTAVHDTLAAVIPPVAEVSGAGVPSLWAIAADAIGNRALDAGSPDAGARLAAAIGGKLPAPRFIEIGGRTFVRRISCCLVFEVPGCQMCTSCPKRPAAERNALLANLAAQS
ncbi:(2Fe-2S)-binding protein [Nocardia sp. NBC_00508]|uniref:(2Fe-2S)-binding protein n=1 Tax=Nocardia sp. NBC_00508 TaxID=2975992 RepID=UPI002E804E57|nr:(2Fe-2S)-binding protein [Nocardia sp. NBC_00508]WUD65308.1 (2Fe-2S)-binding protein [Nocardia sp. NBC_00508]